MISAIAPFILLGLIPLFISYSVEIKWVRNFGILFTVGGFGDLWFFISLLFKKGRFYVLDHPDKTGIYLVEKPDQFNIPKH